MLIYFLKSHTVYCLVKSSVFAYNRPIVMEWMLSLKFEQICYLAYMSTYSILEHILGNLRNVAR